MINKRAKMDVQVNARLDVHAHVEILSILFGQVERTIVALDVTRDPERKDLDRSRSREKITDNDINR